MAMKHETLAKEMVEKARAQDRRNWERMKQYREHTTCSAEEAE